MTAEEFYLLPEPEEGGKLELIDGLLAYEAAASGQHGTIAGNLIGEISPFIRRHRLGRLVPGVGFILSRSPDTVRAPDVAFVSREAMGGPDLPEEGWVPYPPSLAIEVVSPSNLDKDVALKVEQYLQAGVPRVWVVRPTTRTVTVHLPDHSSRTLLPGSELTSEDAGFSVAGFELPVATIFAVEE